VQNGHARMRFGLLTYRTQNVGDDIQSLAAKQFLPQVDEVIDRDLVGDCDASGEPIAVVMNGWFSHRPYSWPPPARIQPLLISMHFSPLVADGMLEIPPRELLLAPPAVDYLRHHGPVGARDLHTLRALEERGVDAYFSGCLTLTLPRADRRQASDCVVLNDVPDEVLTTVRRKTTRPILHTTHDDKLTVDPEERLAKAQALVDVYANAHCVITTRLHCAMPCLALGTPVLLLDTSWDQSRFAGLNTLVRHCTVDEFLRGVLTFDVDRPEPNSAEHEPLRRRLEEQVRAFVADPPARPGVDPSALRAQTLVHVGAELRQRLSTSEADRRRLSEVVDELTRERDTLARTVAELRAGADAERRAHDDVVTALISEREQVRRELAHLRSEIARISNSTEWRAVSRLKRTLHRHPRLSSPARHLFNRIVGRIS